MVITSLQYKYRDEFHSHGSREIEFAMLVNALHGDVSRKLAASLLSRHRDQ